MNNNNHNLNNNNRLSINNNNYDNDINNSNVPKFKNCPLCRVIIIDYKCNFELLKECPICFEEKYLMKVLTKKNNIIKSCTHEFCKECIVRIIPRHQL